MRVLIQPEEIASLATLSMRRNQHPHHGAGVGLSTGIPKHFEPEDADGHAICTGASRRNRTMDVESSEPSHNIDWFIFISTVVVIVGVCVPLILFPDDGRPIGERSF